MTHQVHLTPLKQQKCISRRKRNVIKRFQFSFLFWSIFVMPHTSASSSSSSASKAAKISFPFSANIKSWNLCRYIRGLLLMTLAQLTAAYFHQIMEREGKYRRKDRVQERYQIEQTAAILLCNHRVHIWTRTWRSQSHLSLTQLDPNRRRTTFHSWTIPSNRWILQWQINPSTNHLIHHMDRHSLIKQVLVQENKAILRVIKKIRKIKIKIMQLMKHNTKLILSLNQIQVNCLISIWTMLLILFYLETGTKC